MHGTRKSCGSLLAALDAHPRVAMQILRHSKIAITIKIYTEVVSARPGTRLGSSVSGSAPERTAAAPGFWLWEEPQEAVQGVLGPFGDRDVMPGLVALAVLAAEEPG